MAGILNPSTRITEAVFLPIPGKVISSSKVLGTSPLYFSISTLDNEIIFLAFVLQSPLSAKTERKGICLLGIPFAQIPYLSKE